jgi:dTDP-glucose 4,6-dehydratase
MNKTILLTGSAGFIYSNFIRKAIYEKHPYNFVSLDMINGNPNSIYSNKNHTFHIADIRDAHVIDMIFQFERPDIVLHTAAESNVDYSLKDPNKFITTNVLGTQNIINACIKHNVSKLIYTSTDEVMGALSSEDDPSWTEDAPLNPRNPYSASKACGELLVKAAHESHGLKYNITRSSNNYGPRQTPDKLIPRVIKCILNDQKIPIYGEGKQIRDWTYVADNVNAVLTILDKGKDNEIYNIGASQECSNVELIQKICNKMGKGHNLMEFIPDPRGGGHDFRYSVDSTKIKSLGWKPGYKLSDGLDATINWYVQNQYFLK